MSDDVMDLPRSAAVIGLGLIGGSIARDLASLGVEVRGYDVDPGNVERAALAGVLTGVLDRSFRHLRAVEVVIVATPIDVALELLAEIAPHTGATDLVMDVGSTKRSVVERAQRCGIGERFVGAHPLAGDHRSGFEASREGLFRDAVAYLCPAPGATPNAVALASELWRRLGARPSLIDATDHDERLAWTSHLPQLLSTALASVLAQQGVSREDLGPGGQQMTRLAGSSPEMWTAIALDNDAALSRALVMVETEIAALRAAVESRDRAGVRNMLMSGRTWSGEG